MSRFEQDREDLLKEAAALVERAEFQPAAAAEKVVVGFRRDGSASFFFGDDLVVQFNSRRELRRGFQHGNLLKAEGGRLISLRRERTATAVHLVRHELDAEETTQFLQLAAKRLADLQRAILKGQYQLHGQVPCSADVMGRIAGWLQQLDAPLAVASRPNAC